MRGPLDDAIAQQRGLAVLEEDAEHAEKRRPPGGKPLLRLMQLLERSGFQVPAEAVKEMAVSGKTRDAFLEQLRQVTVASDGDGNGKPARGRKAAKPLDASEIADAYREVGELLGPPTATGPQWRSLGPWTIPNGQTYGASRVNVSGRVAAIAVASRERPRTCSAVRRTAACGRASTAARAGRRGPTTPPRSRSARSRSTAHNPQHRLLRHRRRQLVVVPGHRHPALDRRRDDAGRRW